MLQLIISLIPFLVILFVLWFKYGKSKNLLNLIFWGSFSTIITMILGIPLQNISIFNDNSFLGFLVTAGLIEELTRLYCTKFSKPQSKNELIYNCFLISAVFTSIEDYCYFKDAADGIKTWLLRALSPMHLFFALIMVIFLCRAFDYSKTNKKKANVYKVLAFVIPVYCHGLWDYSLLQITSLDVLYKRLLFSPILCYLLPIIYILVKVKPNENNEVPKVNIWKKLIMIIYGLLVLLGFHV